MRSVGVTTRVPVPNGMMEPDHDHDHPDGQGMCIENELDVNSIGPIELGQLNGSMHGQHQQPQVQWESYLPLRSLKVLLVENDDSTRHIVSALLRNCSYEVIAVENGQQAWKLLIDLNKQIDLVLTELVMPYLSGIGLLYKIMNHATRKNIPVIMMSSDDSTGIVFNCLSRGAVDFLVKPVRKNELKNLWQHVWRKCNSQSSGSESGIRDDKATKSRSNEESDDDINNDDEDDEVSIELHAKDGSDNGSGTQNSWPKRVVEVDSCLANISWDNVRNPHDITSAQVASPEASIQEIIEMGKDLKIGVTKSSSFDAKDTNKKKMDKFCELNMKKVDDNLDASMLLGCENGAPRPKPLGSAETSNAHMEALKSTHLLKSINNKAKSTYYSKESPVLELSLKRVRDVDEADVIAQERSILRHSSFSDFSRYNTVLNVNQDPTGNVDSCSPPNMKSNSNGTPNNRSNGSDDMGSTTNNVFKTKPDEQQQPQPPNGSTTVVHNHHITTVKPPITSTIEGEAKVKTTVGQPKQIRQQVQVRHHHHHYHHHHHHVHKLQQPKMVEPDDGSLRNMVSNILTASSGGNAANFGSASGSNNKSNGENGVSWPKGGGSDPVVEGGKTDSDIADVKKTNGGDQERLARREAALNKFRQKRKERCFDKKVRYENKKKLAEKRPRVRGQFVSHGFKN